MKPALLTALLLLTSCTVQLKDERIDAARLDAILKEQSAVMVALVEKLKEKGILEKEEDNAKPH